MKDNKQVKRLIIRQLTKYNEAMLDGIEQAHIRELLEKVEWLGIDLFTQQEKKLFWKYLEEIFEESKN